MNRPSALSPRRTLDADGWLALAGGAAGGVSVAVYLVVAIAEKNNPPGQIAAWALVMAAPTVLALTAPLTPRRASPWILAAAAFLFLPLVVLTSIGPGFLVASLLTAAAALSARAKDRAR